MRINKKLADATTFNPTKKSYSMTVEEMCKKIELNQLTLPLYQRDVSWNLEKSIALLNFQLFGKAPVAPISINEYTNINSGVMQISFINRDIVEFEENSKEKLQAVVDGQQRLTTSFKAYIGDESFRSVVLDITKAKFRLVEGAIDTSCIPVGILLNKDPELLEKYLESKKTMKLYGLLTRIRSKLISYNYTINIAENLSEDEQIEWFELLNNAGSRVTALQMAFSKLKARNLDIYKDFTKPFRLKLEQFGLEDHFIKFTTNVSYPIAALNPAYEVITKEKVHNNNYAPIPSDTKEDIIIKADVEILHNIITTTLNALDLALNFIEENSLLSDIDRMDYILYILGFFVYNNNTKTLGDSRKKYLINWVRTTNFTNLSNTERRKEFTDLLNLR